MEQAKPAEGELIAIRLPVWWTFGGLVSGLALGWLLAGSPLLDTLLPVTDIVGSLWLRALQMTIIPLVASLLVLGRWRAGCCCWLCRSCS